MRFADCHPDRKHYGKGFCHSCWQMYKYPRVSIDQPIMIPTCHPEKKYHAKDLCFTCYKRNQHHIQEQDPSVKKRNRENQNKRKLSQREEVLKFLGGRCVSCGFMDARALQVDHMNGGGNKERKKTGGTYGVYCRVLAGEEGYQLLCANCNWIKRVERREYNPHGIGKQRT